ncbi:signal peptidase II [bacterium]|nr:signal peptidase II [bacterium]
MKIKSIIYILVIFILDQVSKVLIVQNLTPHQSIPILGDILRFTLIFNVGGAFGTKLGGTLFYLVMTISATIAIIVYFLVNKQQSRLLNISLVMVLGGAIGNLVDRVRLSKVIDFLDMGIGNLRWPIYNVADMAITFGLILLIITSFKQDGRNKNNSQCSGRDRTHPD